MQSDDTTENKKNKLNLLKNRPVIRNVFLYQLAAITTVALCCSVFFVYSFSKNRVPEVIQEHKVSLKQQLIYLNETLQISTLKDSIVVAADELGISKSDLLRYPRGKEVFLYEKDDKTMKLFRDPTNSQLRTREWQPDIRMFDESKGALYIATETGQLLFSNIKIKNVLNRGPVKEYFDSGVQEGVRLYQTDGSGVIAGFSKVKGSNVILFFENPLFGMKTKLKSNIAIVVIGAAIAAFIVALLSYLALTKLAAPFAETERVAYKIATEEELGEIHNLNDKDFGPILNSLQHVNHRIQFYSSEHQRLMEKFRLLQMGMDRIRSSSSIDSLLQSWLGQLEKVIDHSFQVVDFYQLDPENKGMAICSRLKESTDSVASSDQISAEDSAGSSSTQTLESTLIQFTPEKIGHLEKVESPQIVDSILLLLRENQIAEKNGYHYLVGHHAKWVMTLKPFPDFTNRPANYLSLSLLASSLDLKLHALCYQPVEEISILDANDLAS